ncbi:MAG TPA: SpoIID/LytB domain-containing protein [Vicinamibacterales bacterium]|nr:SpoIID/LytB domain-containing protein [Vicinamibacterales bacterium]
MARRRALAVLALLTLAASGAIAARSARAQETLAPRVAWAVVELSTGRVIDSRDQDLLAQPVLPGSLVKVPALVALLEEGVVDSTTRIACLGSDIVSGRRIGCQHARRAHALSAVEALALSCNVFFARASVRLSRDHLDRVLASFGWPSVPADRSLALVASGIQASPIGGTRLLEGWRALLSDPSRVSMRSPTRKVVWDALRATAREGSAAALAVRGIDGLAKTGTSTAADGRSMGLVLAAWPAARPARAALVVVEGGTGPDAAAIVATLGSGGRPDLPAPAQTRAGRAPAAVPRASQSEGAAPQRPSAHTVPTQPQAAPSPDDATIIRVGTLDANRRYVIRSLALEEYVARVLAGEAAPRTPPAALEALAIAARSFALANRRRHAHDGFDLCDSTHCQVLRSAYAATQAAAGATAGQVLEWHGSPAAVYYTASCGGRTERPSAVWPRAADPPFLLSRRDRGCGGEPRWAAELSAAEVQRALVAAGYSGSLKRVKIRRRADSGRVAVLALDGMTPDAISGQDFRMAIGRTLGWQILKSTAFELGHRRGRYTFKGRGYGHGVGFCVIGAMRRAAAGASRPALLDAYFPGVHVADYRTLRLPAPLPVPPGVTPPALASGEAETR